MMHVIFVVLKSLLTIVPIHTWVILIGVVVVWGIAMRYAWQLLPKGSS